MSQDVRVNDDDQDEPDGMPVAAWAFIAFIAASVGAGGWLTLMHRAGSGKGLLW